MAKRTKPRINLKEMLQKEAFDHGLICTFTFDPQFFEAYCLEELDTLNANNNLSILVDQGTYEEILGNTQYFPKLANIRYYLHPIPVPGVFHPKVFLFTSAQKGRLIIGSSNFTRPGITSNAELVGCYEFERNKNELALRLFQEVFSFIQDISTLNLNQSLKDNLDDIVREVPWLLADHLSEEISGVSFLHNMTKTLWDQLRQDFKPSVDVVSILSRYFDAQPKLLDQIQKDLKPKKIRIYTQYNITNMTAAWLAHPSIRSGKTEIYQCIYKDEDYQQSLHAKALAIQKGDKITLVFGSANFTTSAMIKTVHNGNVECLLKLCGLNSKEVKIDRLFDPAQSAIRLKDGMGLPIRPEFLPTATPEHKIQLQDTFIDNGKIYIDAIIPKEWLALSIMVKFRFQNDTFHSLPLKAVSETQYLAEVSKGLLKRFDDSVIAQIEVLEKQKNVGKSNCIFVSNHQDAKGQNLKQKRSLKCSHESSQGFWDTLNRLSIGGDQQALLNFLMYCDIPVLNATRPSAYFRYYPLSDSSGGMRQLKKKNLVDFKELHSATIYFVDRHLKKLYRHVYSGTIDGVVNFLHIFLSIGRVLKTQLERLAYGLEDAREPLSVDDWAQYRNQIDEYMYKFEKLMNCLSGEYLKHLCEDYKRNDIKDQFQPDMNAIQALFQEMMGYRSRVEALRKNRLRIWSKDGKIKPPSYFAKNFFEPVFWKIYYRKQHERFTEMMEIVG